MKLFDTHVHLNNKKLFDDLDNVIQKAVAANVSKMLCVGYDIESSQKAIDIAKKYPNIVYAAVGIHPTECNDIGDDDLLIIEKMLKEENVVALGEIGLDYYWKNVSKEKQKEFFIKQVEIAKKSNVPIIIHSREATKDTYDILKETDISSIGGIMHSYASSPEMAKKFIELNMYISLSGVVTFNNAKKTKDVAKEVSLDRLLIETDCPYLTPMPYRGKTNYPEYTFYVAQEIAKQKDLDISVVIEKTYNNACALFKINNN